MIVIRDQQMNAFAQAMDGRVVKACPGTGAFTIVQRVTDRSEARPIDVSKDSVARRAPQYINVARPVADLDPPDDQAYDIGPRITLCAVDDRGEPVTVDWSFIAGEANFRPSSPPLLEQSGYQPAGFGTQDRTRTVKAASQVDFHPSTCGGDTFRVVATRSGEIVETMEFAVWRRIWCDVVEMKRPNGAGTFGLDAGAPGSTVAGIRAAFAPVYIDIVPVRTDTPARTGQYEQELTNETAPDWPPPPRGRRGLTFNLAVVNRYVEPRRGRWFLRFETFQACNLFDFDRGAFSIHAVRIKEAYDESLRATTADDYWTRRHIWLAGTHLDWIGADDVKRNDRRIRLPTIPAEQEPCAAVYLEGRSFLHRCTDLEEQGACHADRCRRSDRNGASIHKRPPRIYRNRYFSAGDGWGETPTLTHEYPDAVEVSNGSDPPCVDIEAMLAGQNPITRRPSSTPAFYKTPWFVEVEIEIDLDPDGPEMPILGMGSNRSPNVFISRGEIEWTQKAVAPCSKSGDEANRVQEALIRTGVHEIGHALGLVPDGAPFRNEAHAAHCGDPTCVMWPFGGPKRDRFHGLPGQDSCHNFLRLLRLDSPFDD